MISFGVQMFFNVIIRPGRNIYIKIFFLKKPEIFTSLTLEAWEKYLSKKPEILIYVTLRACRVNISARYDNYNLTVQGQGSRFFV